MPAIRETSIPNSWELTTKLLSSLSTQSATAFPRIMFVGAPSCGKSYLASVVIPRLLGKDVEQVVCSDRMDSCELIGTKELVSGNGGVVTSISLGPAARALSEGKPLLLDEADMTNRDVRGVLHGLMDDKPFCTDAAGNRINAKPGYMTLLTSNVTPDCFEPAVRDRIEFVLRFTEPNPEAMQHWPKELQAVNLAAYRSNASAYKWSAPISTRRINAYLSALKMFGNEALAAYVTFGDSWKEFLSACANQR